VEVLLGPLRDLPGAPDPSPRVGDEVDLAQVDLDEGFVGPALLVDLAQRLERLHVGGVEREDLLVAANRVLGALEAAQPDLRGAVEELQLVARIVDGGRLFGEDLGELSPALAALVDRGEAIEGRAVGRRGLEDGGEGVHDHRLHLQAPAVDVGHLLVERDLLLEPFRGELLALPLEELDERVPPLGPPVQALEALARLTVAAVEVEDRSPGVDGVLGVAEALLGHARHGAVDLAPLGDVGLVANRAGEKVVLPLPVLPFGHLLAEELQAEGVAWGDAAQRAQVALRPGAAPELTPRDLAHLAQKPRLEVLGKAGLEGAIGELEELGVRPAAAEQGGERHQRLGVLGVDLQDLAPAGQCRLVVPRRLGELGEAREDRGALARALRGRGPPGEESTELVEATLLLQDLGEDLGGASVRGVDLEGPASVGFDLGGPAILAVVELGDSHVQGCPEGGLGCPLGLVTHPVGDLAPLLPGGGQGPEGVAGDGMVGDQLQRLLVALHGAAGVAELVLEGLPEAAEEVGANAGILLDTDLDLEEARHHLPVAEIAVDPTRGTERPGVGRMGAVGELVVAHRLLLVADALVPDLAHLVIDLGACRTIGDAPRLSLVELEKRIPARELGVERPEGVKRLPVIGTNLQRRKEILDLLLRGLDLLLHVSSRARPRRGDSACAVAPS